VKLKGMSPNLINTQPTQFMTKDVTDCQQQTINSSINQVLEKYPKLEQRSRFTADCKNHASEI
jgi:hypothetical protein